MKISGISSPQSQAPSAIDYQRRSFALLGPSILLDPRVHAVRRDLADVRLADRVFAPHYAAPVVMMICRAGSLRDAPGTSGTIITELIQNSKFEALDFSGNFAWGIAQPAGLVGYIDADMLDIATRAE